jgi:hypothetical protein
MYSKQRTKVVHELNIPFHLPKINIHVECGHENGVNI